MHGRKLTQFFLLILISNAYGQTQFDSYLSLIAHYSDSQQLYRDSIDKEGSLDDGVAIVRLQHRVENHWTMQANFRALTKNDYAVDLQKVFANWQADNVNVRMGRLAYPIGLFSDRIGQGYELLWIRPPESYYNLHPFGPNVVHDGMTGLALTLNRDAAFETEAFFGHADLANGKLKQLLGLKFQLRWRELLKLQLAAQNGYPSIDKVGGLQIDDETKTGVHAGIQAELGPWLLLAEWARVGFGPRPLDTDVSYVGLAVGLGNISPYVLAESWRTDAGWGESAALLGLKLHINSQWVIKFEGKRIQPESVPRPDGAGLGLFAADPGKDHVQLFSMAFELKFKN